MNHEFMEALDELEKDRGIDKEILCLLYTSCKLVKWNIRDNEQHNKYV